MSVCTMKKLTLIAMKGDADALMRRLMWLSCVEVEKAAPQDAEEMLSHADYDTRRGEESRMLAAAEAALATLKKYGKKKGGLFASRHESTAESFDRGADSDTLKLIESINARSERLAELRVETQHIESETDALSVWLGYDAPLSVTSTADAQIRLGTLPASADKDELSARLSQEAGAARIDIISENDRAKFAVVYYHNSVSGAVKAVLGQAGWAKIEFKDAVGTPSEETDRLMQNLAQAKSEIEQLIQSLADDAEKKNEIETARDIIKTDLGLTESKQGLFCTAETVFMTAWTPISAQKNVSKVLDAFDCCYEFTDPAEEDTPPSLLNNNAVATPFETVVSMYSLPKYKTFDPTFIMSIFYFVIFGLMLGDVAYGLILSLGGLVALKLLKPRGSLKNLITLFAICGIACIGAGVLFGSYFGDLPSSIMINIMGMDKSEVPKLALLLDPTTNPIGLLAISLGVGVLHLFCGMGIKFYILCREGKWLDAVFDIGSWYVLFVGLGLVFVAPQAGKITAIAGVAMLVLTQGRHEKNILMKIIKGVGSLYDSISYLSDLLSYSRIMALGLASTVIASVVNILGAMGGIVGVIVAVLLGHLLNLVINLLGTFVHTSRLQYIEFFGKFYEDGGRPFVPVAPDTQYTDIIQNK